MRILLAEDDAMIGKAIKNALENDNHVVDWMTDGDLCEAALDTAEFGIIILDINLPKKSEIFAAAFVLMAVFFTTFLST